MDIVITPQDLTVLLKEAFGEGIQLPLVFGYSDKAVAATEKQGGCLFKYLAEAREGTPVTLTADNVTCGGGKLYTGFAPMNEHIPNFVSAKERYKQSPEAVLDYIAGLDIHLTEKPYLNIQRLDKVETFDGVEGLFFFATPDVLSGLASWAYYDTPGEDAVSAPFGSGCATMFQLAVRENRMNGNRTFLGLFDPSVRPYVGADELGFLIPRCRLATMQHTLRKCCLFGTHAWGKVRERINK